MRIYITTPFILAILAMLATISICNSSSFSDALFNFMILFSKCIGMLSLGIFAICSSVVIAFILRSIIWNDVTFSRDNGVITVIAGSDTITVTASSD